MRNGDRILVVSDDVGVQLLYAADMFREREEPLFFQTRWGWISEHMVSSNQYTDFLELAAERKRLLGFGILGDGGSSLFLFVFVARSSTFEECHIQVSFNFSYLLFPHPFSSKHDSISSDVPESSTILPLAPRVVSFPHLSEVA